MTRPARGFTLIEVIIALFVVALGIGALLTTLASSADSLGRLRDKSMAEWIALNRISEVRLTGRKPSTEATSGTVEYGGRSWAWLQTVSDPGIAGMLRIDVQVAPAESGKAPAVIATNAEQARRDFGGIATAYGFFGTAVAQASGIDPDWSVAAAGPPAGPPGGPPAGPGANPVTGPTPPPAGAAQ